MTRAKQLRRSTTEFVRRHVFINRNMTKVEAKMAYEERCRRRRRQAISDQPATQRRHDGQRSPRTTNDYRPDHNRPEAAAAPTSDDSSEVATLSVSRRADVTECIRVMGVRT